MSLNERDWYFAAIAAVIVGAPTVAHTLFWLFKTEKPGRARTAVLYAMCGFVLAVLLFAYLFDSSKIAFHDSCLGMFLAVGVIGALALALMERRKEI